jgi:hypothetical protein|nr:MAG TPA: hypothetical protein [Caudoviricetes sp.]
MQQKNIATILPPMTEVFSGVLKWPKDRRDYLVPL